MARPPPVAQHSIPLIAADSPVGQVRSQKSYDWYSNFEIAKQVAQRQNPMIFVFALPGSIDGDTCGAANAMRRISLLDPIVADWLASNAVLCSRSKVAFDNHVRSKVIELEQPVNNAWRLPEPGEPIKPYLSGVFDFVPKPANKRFGKDGHF